jgi:hypothetical protein
LNSGPHDCSRALLLEPFSFFFFWSGLSGLNCDCPTYASHIAGMTKHLPPCSGLKNFFLRLLQTTTLISTS